MLKWLRKYNTWILVVGGVLLMIAFLMPTTIQELGKRRLSGPYMRINREKVSFETYSKSALEYAALSELIDRKLLQGFGGGDSARHWLLLTHEAEKGGFIGGVDDGEGVIQPLAEAIASAKISDPQQAEMFAGQIALNIRDRIPRVAADAHMSKEQVFKALAKMQGILRMRTAYNHALRFSDRRLVAGVKDIADQAEIEFVFVSPDHLITGETPAPDDAAIAAHFDRYKDVRWQDNEFGLGYRMPDRIKLAWLFIDRQKIIESVDPDPVAVQRRIRQQYPQGLPRTEDADPNKAKITSDVRAEQADSVIKTLDQAVRGEIERATRRLEPDQDQEYKRLPPDWASQRPDLRKIAESAAARATELTGQRVPAPQVEVRDSWLIRTDIRAVPPLAGASLKRGTRNDPADAVLFSVRELAGNNDFALQVGVPSLEPLADAAGDKIYFMVLEARKASPPDSVNEVKEQVIRDIKRFNAFEALKPRLDEFCSLAKSQGLKALTKPIEGATGPAAESLVVARAQVLRKDFFPQNDLVNSKEFRDAVMDRAAMLDPLADLEKVDPAERTVCMVAPKGLGLVVAQITGISPTTIERFRRQQGGMVFRLQSNEFEAAKLSDPFSQAQLEKSLNVEYFEKGGQGSPEDSQPDKDNT